MYTWTFSSVRRLEKKSVLNSRSERQAWIASLAECLRYLSVQPNEFAAELATSVHRTWLERALGAPRDGALRADLVRHSAVCMSALARYWLRRAEEEHGEKYDQLARNFWQNIGATLLMQISKVSVDREIAHLAEDHILLVKTLKTGFVQDAKSQLSVTFDGDAPAAPQRPPAEAAEVALAADAAGAQLYRHNLAGLAQRLCAAYLELGGAALVPLVPLLREFDSRELFAAVAAQMRAPEPFGLYERVLRPWLADDATRSRAMVDVVFLLMRHLSEEEQDAVFDSFRQVSL